MADTGYPEIRQKSISGRIISDHRISGPTLYSTNSFMKKIQISLLPEKAQRNFLQEVFWSIWNFGGAARPHFWPHPPLKKICIIIQGKMHPNLKGVLEYRIFWNFWITLVDTYSILYYIIYFFRSNATNKTRRTGHERRSSARRPRKKRLCKKFRTRSSSSPKNTSSRNGIGMYLIVLFVCLVIFRLESNSYVISLSISICCNW